MSEGERECSERWMATDNRQIMICILRFLVSTSRKMVIWKVIQCCVIQYICEICSEYHHWSKFESGWKSPTYPPEGPNTPFGGLPGFMSHTSITFSPSSELFTLPIVPFWVHALYIFAHACPYNTNPRIIYKKRPVVVEEIFNDDQC